MTDLVPPQEADAPVLPEDADAPVPSDQAPTDAAGPVDPAPTGASWPPPVPPRRGRRRLVVVAVLVVAILAVGYIGIRFLGLQVQEVLKGTVEFGASGAGCDVSDPGSTFPPDKPIYFAAHLTREVPVGEEVTMRLLQDGNEVGSVPRTFKEAATCLAGSVPANAFTAGHFHVEYGAGAEVLAKGEFDVGP